MVTATIFSHCFEKLGNNSVDLPPSKIRALNSVSISSFRKNTKNSKQYQKFETIPKIRNNTKKFEKNTNKFEKNTNKFKRNIG